MDITKVSTSILKQNIQTYSRRLPDAQAQAKIDAAEAELARRSNRTSVVGGNPGYVLTRTGQFEHIAADDKHTKCGKEIDRDREYGEDAWWHCLSCQR